MKFWTVTEGIHMNNSAEKIPVFFHTSDEFCPYMCVAIASILYNTKSFIDFYIIETGVSNFNKKLIASLKEKFSNFNINWISFEYNNIFKREYFENLNGNDKGKPWPGIHAFCTPFMPLLVDTSIDKLIYLDSDIILLDDIKLFYEHDITDYYLGAIPDVVVPLINTSKISAMNSYINKHDFGIYFNAGVLLLNAKKFREENIIDKYFQIAQTETVSVCDQDILNRLFQNSKYKKLDQRFNVIFQPSQKLLDEKGFNINKEYFATAQQNAIIRHFANNKPWFSTTENWENSPLSNFKDWWFFAQMTPFYDGLTKELMFKLHQNSNYIPYSAYIFIILKYWKYAILSMLTTGKKKYRYNSKKEYWYQKKSICKKL